MSGGTQIYDISLDQPGGGNANSVPKKVFSVFMKSYVLFLILTLYSVNQRVSVSLLFQINIVLLLGKPLFEKISSVKG